MLVSAENERFYDFIYQFTVHSLFIFIYEYDSFSLANFEWDEIFLCGMGYAVKLKGQ